ncbi:hypothetical protein [Sphingobacterium chungjuense]|uniref:hypothetical protein n=1 Tax=Sphingobacterium chungjuense TaxID=2675553 RepID=UPI0014080A20|nr:hypothetical protein [Sphingobacterium chungjuense]
MNKIYWILSTILLLVFGCSESEVIPIEPGTEVQERMRSHFSSELKCTKQGEMQTNLYQGNYEGKIVYYVFTMCLSCLQSPPKSGFTEKLVEVTFADFRKVNDIQLIYDSCTKKFAD